MDTLSPRVDGAVPAVEERESQDAVLLAVQLSVPPPVLEMLMFWVAGLEPPAVAVKDAVFEDTVNTGAAALTTNVTATFCGEPTAPLAVTVMVSL